MLSSTTLAATYTDTNTAHMQAMDKITGKVSEIDVPVNGEVKFGSFSIVVRKCVTSAPEDTPENIAFVDVADTYNTQTPVNIFKGWMFSSSPALNAVEHPIYDVWLLKCINKNISDNKVLISEELKARDNIFSTQQKETITFPPIAPIKDGNDNTDFSSTEETLSNEEIKETPKEVISVVVNQTDSTDKEVYRPLSPSENSTVSIIEDEENGFSETDEVAPNEN